MVYKIPFYKTGFTNKYLKKVSFKKMIFFKVIAFRSVIAFSQSLHLANVGYRPYPY
jgi:hypothetical protein